MRELTVVEAVPAVSTHSESMVFLDYGKGRGGEKQAGESTDIGGFWFLRLTHESAIPVDKMRSLHSKFVSAERYLSSLGEFSISEQ